VTVALDRAVRDVDVLELGVHLGQRSIVRENVDIVCTQAMISDYRQRTKQKIKRTLVVDVNQSLPWYGGPLCAAKSSQVSGRRESEDRREADRSSKRRVHQTERNSQSSILDSSCWSRCWAWAGCSRRRAERTRRPKEEGQSRGVVRLTGSPR
jgi:hypothetical protein